MRIFGQRGFSLIELLIVAAVASLFFGGLFVAIQSSLKLVVGSRARMSALSVANDQLEYVRSLSYSAVGTVSGIPSGSIPQISTTTLNGINFTRRTLIEYVDDPADGVGAADSNSITTDYKQVKVEVSWESYETSESMFLVTNIVPKSIETSVGGGTIRVNVYDASVAPVPGASVRLTNTTGTTSIDVTRTTDATGIALFGGAPANSNYEVFVTKAGYSFDQTYAASGTLANPTSQPFAVVEADVTTVNFFIDELSTLGLRLLTDYTAAATTYDFASTSDVLFSTSTAVSSGSLVLRDTAGVYDATGEAFLAATTPTPLARWDYVGIDATVPPSTSWKAQLYSDATLGSLIPDTDLPGNAVGFSAAIDISGLSIVTYPSLYIKMTLETSNSAVTPDIAEVVVHYRDNETPLGSTSVTITGSKTIGTDAATAPIYKNTITQSTDSAGALTFTNLEWDAYTWNLGGYDVAETCSTYPLSVTPGEIITSEYVLAPNTANSLRVTVVNSSNEPIPDATVRLVRSGNVTKTTGRCGQAFFDNLSAATDYRLEVSAPNYTSTTIDPLSVSGDIVQTVTL